VISKSVLLFLPAAGLGLLAACSSSNSTGLQTGCSGTTTSLDVVVTNSTNECEYICNATVTATLGSTSVTLKPSGGTGTCSYEGDVPTGGTYSIVVNAPGYPQMTSTDTIQTGCSQPFGDVTVSINQ
jgi:hypothetical protein